MGLLDGGIAGIVGRATAGITLSGTLTRASGTTVDSYGDPVTSSTDYAFRGFREDYSAAYRARAGIPVGDCRIMIVATSLAVAPQVDDLITLQGKSYRARVVSTDPATAMFDCQVFEVG